MGRHLKYRPGSFYRTDDRTGFPQRAEQTRRQWNGIITDERVWDYRQPQDLVRGVPDRQNVPEPRPLAANVFLGPTFTTLSANVAVGVDVIPLASTAGLFVGASVSVMLDSGVNFNSTLTAVGASTVTLAEGLVGASAASGNNFTNNTTHIPAEP